MLKNKSTLLAYIISICFILSALLLSIHFCCFDRSFYYNEHHNIVLYDKPLPEYIGISENELAELTDFVLDYLNDRSLTLDKQMKINNEIREVFTQDEKDHMVDVRNLNLISIDIMAVSLFIFSVCLIYYVVHKMSSTLLFNKYLKVLILFLIIFAFLGMYILTDFNSFWNYFHKIFFASNNLWILDLRKDILIMIVPPIFFEHLVKRIVIIFLASIVLFALLLKLISRKKYD